MTDLQYTVGVNTQRARQSLQRLNTQTQRSTEAFNGLRNAIGLLAIGSIVRSVANTAAELRDLSNATDISVNSLESFRRAVGEVGGDTDRASTAIERFVTRSGEALQSASLQEEFNRIGVSLSDLQRLSTEELFAQTIRGISELETVTERAAAANRLLGRDMRGLDIPTLVRRFTSLRREMSDDVIRATENLGDAMQTLDNAMESVSDEIVVLLDPISRLVTNMENLDTVVSRTVSLLLQLAAVFAALKVVGVVVGGFAAFFALFARNATTVTAVSRQLSLTQRVLLGLGNIVSGVTGTFGRLNSGIRQVVAAVSLYITGANTASVRSRFLRVAFATLRSALGPLGAALLAVHSALTLITGSGFISWTRTAISETGRFFRSIDENATKFGRFANAFRSAFGSEDISIGSPEIDTPDFSISSTTDQIQDSLQKQKNTVNDIVSGFKERNRETIVSLQQEKELIGLSENQARVQQTINDFTEDYKRQLFELNSRLEELNQKPVENAEEIQLVNQAIAQSTELYEQQLPIVENLAKSIENKRIAEEATAEAVRRTERFVDSLAESTELLQRDLRQVNMTPFQRQLDDIENRIRQRTRREVRALKADLETVVDPQARQQIRQQIDEIERAAESTINTQKNLAKETRNIQRSFSSGWQRAFREYEDNATNAARKAQRIFETTTRGIEDAIVNFARTGKFEFRDLVNVILEELLRLQVQQTVAQIFSPNAFGGGGGSSFLPGGPSLGLGDLIGSIGSGIGGAVRGIGDFFGGFFATGGMIPPNRFGVVGENGPELVSGPANVTPMGNTQVTYNINAVDARSFRELVATDPQFIYAVSEQGRKSVPGRR